jgi:hypothetical protein
MKPTPLQARALRVLATDMACLRFYGRGQVEPELDLPWKAKETEAEYERQRERHEAFNRATKEAGLKRLRQASADAMERAGWLELIEKPHERARMILTEAGREMVQLLSPEDFEDRSRPTPELLPLALIYGALRDRWPSENGWVWFTEFSAGIKGRRIDGLAVNRWGNKWGYKRMAFEIKRSRGDFLGELRDPGKRQDSASVADCFWFVTPAGMVQATEVPGDCGLVWIDEDGRAQVKRKAPKREPTPTDRRLLGAILTYIVDRPTQREWRKAMKEHGL